MTPSLDTLLADARIPTSSHAFDVAAGLRRLAADAVTGAPTLEVVRASQAARRLSIMCRWALNAPDAATHVGRLVQDPAEDRRAADTDAANLPTAERHAFEDKLDIQGAAVFACLLSLTDQPESAQFWWQLAAGAGNRVAAYCLHLHHLVLGETREAQHWYHQVIRTIEDCVDLADTAFIDGLGTVAGYRGRHSPATGAPLANGLEVEVDRLASRHPSGIVSRPDRQLADRLADFAKGR
ncbi:hypothetical protein NMG29_40080 [Streptomyces cocklensis]|uniref:Uncharacterized protein n=1 Tax=Actinacidiphila cocklensis TaxID=887465 RepID=A0A9W4GU16_9ACTN|nr:hypothetical protein [Actinacidiphila cocklensis]MDD1064260.1 hypothetical protein [Actinacidiphila cocklensis]WSX75699.1 hypothetical protein OH826_18620 [Streptomyces sp. NBC_00899]CAG6395255.1 conserved hypothetical protein [Actinacidiphila cocklensis]